jgi:peptidoglycan/xylan/chitin deacetylase (PgdA/CDA1 family)
MEYHRFGPKEERWTRTPANFRKDLEFFYNNGYYLVNARDLAERKLDVPAGKKPLVLTFDDATDVQFRYLKGADGKPDPNKIDPDCAVGMLDEFHQKHPDFGQAGTFYVLPSGFEQDGVIQQKFKYLESTNREIGNHTWSHDNMSTMSVEKVNLEIGKCQHFIHQQLGDAYEVKTLALPFGIGPKNDTAFKAVSDGGTGADAHHFKALLLVGANPTVSPYDKKYKATAVARIQGIDSEFKNWFNRKPGSTDKVKEPWVPYVSDGDPAKVTFPKGLADKLNKDALGSGVSANPFDPKAAASAAPASPSPTTSAAPGASAPASPQTQGADTIPGYTAKLPAGGSYANGKLTYKIKSGDSTEDIAWKFIKFTDFYTYPSLAKAIKAENKLDKGLTVGDTITIPKARTAPPKPTIVPREKTFEAKGIYVTGTIAGSGEVWDLVKDLKAHGGNTVVFDAKDMNGVITYKTQVPLAKEIKAYKGDMIQDLPKFIERLHAEGIHAVARVAQFHDALLAQHKPQYALVSKKSGKPWREAGDLVWVDASIKEVQDYQLALAKELIANGVDEIQLDYVRFPAMGETHDIIWSTAKTLHKEKKDVITAYVKRAKEEIAPTKALLSADVYGVVAWDQGIDVRITGQKMEELGHYLDAISPMLYPSHFYSDFDHFSYPPDHPQYFIGEGVRKTAKKLEGTGCTIRPWLQAFPYRIHNYGPQYVAVQLKANAEAKANGWLLWNAENSYKTGFAGVTMFGKGGLPNEQMPKRDDDQKKVAASPKKN